MCCADYMLKFLHFGPGEKRQNDPIDHFQEFSGLINIK